MAAVVTKAAEQVLTVKGNQAEVIIATNELKKTAKTYGGEAVQELPICEGEYIKFVFPDQTLLDFWLNTQHLSN